MTVRIFFNLQFIHLSTQRKGWSTWKMKRVLCLSVYTVLLVYAPCTVSEIRAFGCQHTWWDRRSNYFMLKEFFAESHKLIRSNLFMLNAIHGGICTISNHPRSNHTRSNHPRLNHTFWCHTRTVVLQSFLL